MEKKFDNKLSQNQTKTTIYLENYTNRFMNKREIHINPNFPKKQNLSFEFTNGIVLSLYLIGEVEKVTVKFTDNQCIHLLTREAKLNQKIIKSNHPIRDEEMTWVPNEGLFIMSSRSDDDFEKAMKAYVRPKDSETFEFVFPTKTKANNEQIKKNILEQDKVIQFICPFVKKNSFTSTKVKIDFSAFQSHNVEPKNKGIIDLHCNKSDSTFRWRFERAQKGAGNSQTVQAHHEEEF